MARSSVVLSSEKKERSPWITMLFFLFVFFPYIEFVKTGSDNQPYALILASALFLMLHIYRLRKEFVYLFVVMAISIAVFLLSTFSLDGVRSVLNYFSLFFISVAVYEVLKRQNGLNPRFLYLVIGVWFFVGLIQTFAYRDFLTFLLPRASTTANRGVIGLAPEPTFYGIVCIFLLLLVLHMKQKKTVPVLLLLVQIVLFSRSSMSMLFLVILMILFTLARLSARTILIALGVVVAGYFVVNTVLRESRIYAVARLVLASPGLILVKDESIADRFYSIYFSLKGSFGAFLLPHGYGAFAQYIEDVAGGIAAVSRTNRIMSGYGSALFELGAVGLLIPVVVTAALRHFWGRDKRSFFIYGAFVNIILFSAIPLSFPYVSFLIGFLFYEGDRKASQRLEGTVGLESPV